MNSKWTREIEQIRQATGLPIWLRSTAYSEWSNVRIQLEADGCEVIRWEAQADHVSYVCYPLDQWPASSRALLPLLLSSPVSQASVSERLGEWLQSSTAHSPFPSELEAFLSWKEARACFFLNRESGQAGGWSEWFSMLFAFFRDPKGQQCLFVPVNNHGLLLLVPVSLFPDFALDRSQADPLQVWIDWAAGIQELFAVEAMETIRVVVTKPAERPHELAHKHHETMRSLDVLKRFRPCTRVAGSWQYPLENWFSTLPASVLEELQRSLAQRLQKPLTAEQYTTLDSFFAYHLNISEAARGLYLHRNTLLYRLDKIKEQTGLDPRLFSDAMLLRLALLFHQERPVRCT
ncbi:MAG: PucR family transcriptional regulator [Clostridia bacterium]